MFFGQSEACIVNLIDFFFVFQGVRLCGFYGGCSLDLLCRKRSC